jgi:hypothetical protein
MRRALCCAGLILLISISPAAAESDVTAGHSAVLSERDPRVDPGGGTDIVAVCTGDAVRSTATVTVTCSVAWAGGGTTMTCVSPVSHGACAVTEQDRPRPIEICSEAVAHLRDGSTATDRRCTTYQ